MTRKIQIILLLYPQLFSNLVLKAIIAQAIVLGRLKYYLKRGYKKVTLEASQLITNHYYLERYWDAQCEWTKLRFGHVQVEELRMRKSALKQLILGNGFKTANLIRESKRRFGLVVRLIANKCYRIFSTTYPS